MLYIVAMLQPVMPLLEYNLNKEYIASVLCENRNKPELACNGKCYLNKQLEKSQEENHNHSVPQIDLSKYPVTPISYNKYTLKEVETSNKLEYFYVAKHPQKYTSSVFRPPIS